MSRHFAAPSGILRPRGGLSGFVPRIRPPVSGPVFSGFGSRRVSDGSLTKDRVSLILWHLPGK